MNDCIKFSIAENNCPHFRKEIYSVIKGILLLFVLSFSTQHAFSNEPDSVYLFSYSTTKNNNHNGLHFAWSPDKKNWFLIGNEYGFVKSDYGRWGSEKRMVTPYLVLGTDNVWHCVWALNEKENLFAAVSSPDLVYWGRQAYPKVQEGFNCLRPIIQRGKENGQYNITYTTSQGKYFSVSTKDFKTFSSPVATSFDQNTDRSITIELKGEKVTGQLHRVPWSVVDKMVKAFELKQYKNAQNAEVTAQDAVRFAGLKPLEAKVTVAASQAKPISDLLLGIFFEDINYAADGGLYAELIQNRDFEYSPADKEGRDPKWNSTHSWKTEGEGLSFVIDSAAPIHTNNAHYATLTVNGSNGKFINEGFDAIVVKKGEALNLSFFSQLQNVKQGKLMVTLASKKNGVVAQTTLNAGGAGWKKLNAVLLPNIDADDVQLELQPLFNGKVSLDMISLMPQKTFKGRKNGLRADLAQSIADIHPRFVRFPGGCVAHGDGLGNIYRWKNTVGALEVRKPQRNLWGYHQSAGLGYFEYFQFCEDIGAAPVPVLAAGVPCQNSGTGGGGQQGGIPMNEMDEYIQDIIDLVEYANGPATSKWGKLRAEAGHPKPFNLKYIGIGNEDLISDVFEERFTMIYHALKKVHPEITIIGTVGPFFEGTDYVEGWDIADKLHVDMVDEHYYQTPGWFINNQEFYDRYDRSKSKVYLGEYAAHLPGRPNNLETALAEAIYLTALERNGDVVTMASYAPLLAKDGHTQWNPNLIYFNNSVVKPTVGYYVQQLYGLHAGNQYLSTVSSLSNNQEAVKKRFAVSVVRDSVSKDVIVKLVNLLPVVTKTSLDLSDINIANTTANKIEMSGDPADKTVKPVSSTVAISSKFELELKPYSFTVIRISTK